MGKHRRFTALALAFALLCALAVPVGATLAPKLTYTQSGNTAKLTLKDLGEESVYGVQLDLTLAGSYDRATLAPASSTAYAPPCTCSVTGSTTWVTVYLTDQSPLNSKGSLELGSLTLPSTFTMPEAATLTLLDRDLKPLYGDLSIKVSRQSTSSGSSGSGGGGGTTRPTPSPTPSLTPSPSPEPSPVPPVPFTDVAENAWYFDAVKYVYDKGMMNGTADSLFSPNLPTSRAMVVTVLYRLAGGPAAQAPTFPDVPTAAYYAYPVGWAAGQSIVTGFEDGSFRPDGLLTREQLATILYRYSRAMGYNTSARGALTGFSDHASISSYAVEPLSWAVGTGLLTGMEDGTISPGAQATRAQVATILTRFCKNVVDPPRGI